LTVEVATASVLALLAWRVDGLPLVAYTWAAIVCVVLCWVDVAVHRLPHRLSLSAFGGAVLLLGAAAITTNQLSRFGLTIACACAVTMFYCGLLLLNPSGIGAGDVVTSSLAGLTAGWHGWPAAIAATLAGFLLSGIFAVALLVSGGARAKDQLPHGPFMLTAALAVVVLAS